MAIIYTRPTPGDYLLAMVDLREENLIVPGRERHLKLMGKSMVRNTFRDTLDVQLEMLIGRTKSSHFSGYDFIPQDPFVAELSELIWQTANQTKIRENSSLYQIRMKGITIAGGIYVLEEAVQKELVLVNPPGSPANDVYLGFRG